MCYIPEKTIVKHTWQNSDVQNDFFFAVALRHSAGHDLLIPEVF
jgi:hypothetical protein